MNHIRKFDQFVNEAEVMYGSPPVEKKPEYWNWEREIVVNSIFDKGLFRDKVAQSLLKKLTSTEKGYTYGMLDQKERELFDKLLGKKPMDPNKRPKFWSTG